MTFLYGLGRFLGLIWLVVSLTFVLLRVLPGDGVRAQLLEAGLGEEAITLARTELGMGQSSIEQYAQYITLLLQGDLGQSFYTRQPISDMLAQRLPRTLFIASLGLSIGTLFACILGIVANYDGKLGQVTKLFLDVSMAIPMYWSATLVLFFVAVPLGLQQDSLLLIVGVLVLHTSAAVGRAFQQLLQDTAHAEFIRFARVKGLPEWHILLRHQLRFVIIGLLPFIVSQFGFLLGGTVITETIFLHNGIGTMLVQAVFNRDYPVVQAVTLLLAIVYGGGVLMSDILTDWLDPRASTTL